MPKKTIDLKTLKFKMILFNKYTNKTMLVIINFRKINEKRLHKILVFERVSDKSDTTAAV